MAEIKRLSIVVPCYNEEGCIDYFIAAVDELILPTTLEFVFVDDGSTDGTLDKLKAFAERDSRVRYVSFSRNFGKESALLAGLEKCTGDAVVTMDADLQHRPEILPKMISLLQNEDCDCVATRRTNRTGEPLLRSWFAHRFYSVMNRFSDVCLVDGSMDYRMMTRQVVDSILTLREVNRFTKGIYQWVGFKTRWIESENADRVAGTTKWSFWGLFNYAIRGILAFSTFPLQLASVLGLLLWVLSSIYMIFVVSKWLIYGDPVAGWPTVICVVLLLGGTQLFVIGILGAYIAGIYREAKNRPLYIVRESK